MIGFADYGGAAITAFLALVLARAAAHKALAFHETVGFAQGYGAVRPEWTPVAVRGLAAAEALGVVLLALPATRSAGALLAAVLFVGYGALMAFALATGRREIDCGCGGVPQPVSGLTLARNAGLAGLAVLTGLAPSGALGPLAAGVAIACGATFFAIYCLGEALAAHLPHIHRAG